MPKRLKRANPMDWSHSFANASSICKNFQYFSKSTAPSDQSGIHEQHFMHTEIHYTRSDRNWTANSRGHIYCGILKT